jgi:D-threo-aldose 1-dehydrogenase
VDQSPDDRVYLGKTAVTVSRLAFGGHTLANLYKRVSEVDAISTLHHAWERGVTHVDTAPSYGSGLSEERLGKAIRARRDLRCVVSTKVGRVLVKDSRSRASVRFIRRWLLRRPPPMFVDVPRVRPIFDFSADGIKRSIDNSLTRLGLDQIDIALVHDPDEHMDEAIRVAIPALIQLRDQGVITGIGAGMNSPEPLIRLIMETPIDCVLLAGRLTLLDQSAKRELLPLCAERGVGYIAAAPFNTGVLADASITSHYHYGRVPPEIFERVTRWRSVCDRHGVPLKAAALQFPLRDPAVTNVLVGMRSPQEVDENLALSQIAIPSEFWDDAISRGLIT